MIGVDMSWDILIDLSYILIGLWDSVSDGCSTGGSTKASLTAGLRGCAVQGQGHDSG